MSEVRPIDANALCEGRVSNDPVVIAAKCTPTLPCEPIRHSQWQLHSFVPRKITVDGIAECPECGCHVYRIVGTWFKRCPNCGANMDGGKENG